MDRSNFMAELYKTVQNFETYWNRNQRGEEPENWPNELPEEDWWEQFLMFVEDNEV